MIRNLASFIPPKWRTVIYSILGTLTLLEGVWNVLPDQYDGKVLATLGFLGFGMAAVNASPPPPPDLPPAGGVPEMFPGEFP